MFNKRLAICLVFCLCRIETTKAFAFSWPFSRSQVIGASVAVSCVLFSWVALTWFFPQQPKCTPLNSPEGNQQLQKQVQTTKEPPLDPQKLIEAISKNAEANHSSVENGLADEHTLIKKYCEGNFDLQAVQWFCSYSRLKRGVCWQRAARWNMHLVMQYEYRVATFKGAGDFEELIKSTAERADKFYIFDMFAVVPCFVTNTVKSCFKECFGSEASVLKYLAQRAAYAGNAVFLSLIIAQAGFAAQEGVDLYYEAFKDIENVQVTERGGTDQTDYCKRVLAVWSTLHDKKIQITTQAQSQIKNVINSKKDNRMLEVFCNQDQTKNLMNTLGLI